MAGAIDPAVGNPLLDALLANGASGSIVIGALTLTAPYKCRFTSTLGTAAAAGTDISSGGTAINGLFTSSAASVSNVPTKANTGAITYTTGSSGTWAGNEIYDANGTPKRVLYGPTSSLAKSFNSGDILSINTSNLTGTVI